MTAPTLRANCSTCGYAMAGLPSLVCPECGSVFDPFEIRPTLRARLGDLAWPLCAISLVCFQFGMYISGVTAGAAEPFRDLGEYVTVILVGAALVGGLFFMPIGGIAGAIWTRSPPSPTRTRTAKTFAIYTASTLLPVTICAFANAFTYMRQGNFGLMNRPKPHWINAGIVDVCANPITLIMGCAAAIWLAAWVRRARIRKA